MFAQEEKEAKLTIGRRANARAGVGVALSGECKAQKASEGEQKRRADKIIPPREKPKP